MVHMRRSTRCALALGVLLVIAAGCSTTSGGANQGAPLRPPGLGGRAPDPSRPAVSGEVDAGREPTSTFAIDIDTASYNYARRRILDGARPDPSTVRPEEFVNAFKQDYPQPDGDGFTVTVDGSRLPGSYGGGGADLRLLRIGLQTRADDPGQRPDAALTFVVDVSGSMAEPGRLDLVKDALHTLVDQLRDTDQVAVVAYDDEARVLREMTPVRNRSALHRAVDDLRVGGSTNLESGLVTGYRVARAGFREGLTNRVILLSDGLANVGSTTAEPILRQIRDEAAKQITLLGVGVGSDYGDALMERLADSGDGFVTYVADRDQARQLFVTQLPATLTVRARDAKVQVRFNDAVVDSYRLIGYDDRALDATQFRDDRVDGGEVGPGHSVTALYLVRLRSTEREGTVAEARVRWLDPRSGDVRERAAAPTAAALGGSFAAASARLRVCFAAAFFAEMLRQSRYGEQVRRTDLAAIAADASRQTSDPQVAELADLIRRS